MTGRHRAPSSSGLPEPPVIVTKRPGGLLRIGGSLFTDHARGIVETVCEPSRREARDRYDAAVAVLDALPEPDRHRMSDFVPASLQWQAAVDGLCDGFAGFDMDTAMYLSRYRATQLRDALSTGLERAYVGQYSTTGARR